MPSCAETGSAKIVVMLRGVALVVTAVAGAA